MKLRNEPLKSLIRTNLPISNIQPLPIEKSGRIFITIALKRSGQHAVINWLGHNLRSAIHLNNCTFVRRHWQVMPLPRAGRFITYRDGNRLDSGCLASPADRHPLEACLKAINDLEPFENLIYSFEDFSLEDHYLKRFIRYCNPTIILILRDPYNLLASSFKHHDGKNSIFDLEVKKKKLIEYLRQVLGIENLLGCQVKSIDYGKWFCDYNYKIDILKKLNLSSFLNDGQAINEIQPFGGGSSFDEKNIDIASLKKRVFERWQIYQNNTEYRNLLNDSSLSKLAFEFFGVEKPF